MILVYMMLPSLKSLSFENVQELNDQDFSDPRSLPCSFGW